jgi:hypothetical protein
METEVGLGPTVFETTNDDPAVVRWPLLAVAVTCSRCLPLINVAVSRR